MIELAPHQREAIERIQAMFDRFGGAILADEAGLGKSFVAASIAAGHRGEVEVIVPASLVSQWQSTLAGFGTSARVVTHDSLLGERFVPRRGGDRLLIVDEAHAFRNPATQRYDALARKSIGAKLLLVTATPICNSPDDLHALVALIAADDALRFAGVASIERAFTARDAESIRAIIAELVIRRERDVLPQSLQFGSIRRRIIRHPVPNIREIDELQFPLVEGHRDLMRRVLWRRLESSAAALVDSVRRQTRFYERALDSLRSGRTLTKREYRRAFGDEEDRDALQEVLFWDVFAPDEARVDVDVIRDEIRRLDAIRAAALAAPSAKRDLLADAIGNQPALVFTSAIATAHDVARALGAGVLTSSDAIPIDAIAAFRRGCIDMLVCTDLASEGLNLQRAGTVVHYDIPWNPVKLDQRNGRAWRIGQMRDEIQAIYFFPESRRTRIVETIAAKNRARRRLLRPSHPLPDRTLAALPPHMPRDAAAVQLLKRLRDAPPQLARRYPAGIERLFAELANEYLDDRRVAEVLELLPV